ncbi:Double-stranded RNA-binding protein Staufen-like protein 2 [Armadillidium nasatum]|uniref:Double-stranded RNA-binding protein Staufen-like protein 2 n=1 Tax=Armadillidium nasatum TaxID=96803 RepID=A0A5N5SJN2_9CRUS|nr:Double-stranded RNA-binding protein Staufen-like protein 2 [Armadillidium nasatum]
MAQVPLRMAQPSLVPPHQQRPPMMVSMTTQPPPVSMQGLVSMAPMMGPGGGMAVMTQAMNHPDSGHDHHTMNGPYHHHHHHPHHPPHGAAPRPHGPSQSHHPVPPPHPSGMPQPPHTAPPHSQYHPHPGAPHHVSHNHHNGPHSVHHSIPHSVSHSHSGPLHPPPPPRMSNHSNSNSSSNHNTQGPQQPHLQSGTAHLSQTSHSMPHHTHQNPMNMINNQNSSSGGSTGISAVVNGIANRSVSGGSILSHVDSSDLSTSTASAREKTPMCLINELARYNKISHQYCLTDEKGPAHKKVFTVTLKLGDNDEEYSASGPSIKKAQHLAAAVALEKTKFKHPPPKTQRHNKQTKLTPTVELNALAMKRGEAAVYTFMEPPRPPSSYAYSVPSNIRNVYQGVPRNTGPTHEKFYGRPSVYPMFFVNLRVGNKDFCGEGATAQQAKHNAASKALKVIKALPIPDSSSSSHSSSNSTTSTNLSTTNNGERVPEIDQNSELKSPISLVHEIALKRSLTVSFEVVRESGPPHMRTFVTTCIVGDIRRQGEGTGKKVSKKRAAELMLEELRKLPPVTSSSLSRVKRKPTTKKKSRNLIKEQKAAPEYGQGINPISRLIQIQQAKKEKEPIYTLVAERGVPRRREFVVQVTVGTNSAQGSGPNKKLAKRAAAESMLQLLGYSRPQPQPAKPAIKLENSHSDSDKTRKQVTFLEETDSRPHESAQSSVIQTQSSISPGGARQLVPGLIMMTDDSALHGYHPQIQPQSSTTAAIAKELLESGSSPTAKALSKNQTNSTQSTTQSHPSRGTVSTPTVINHQQQSPLTGKSQQSSISPVLNHQSIIQSTSGGHQNSQQQQSNNTHSNNVQASHVTLNSNNSSNKTIHSNSNMIGSNAGSPPNNLVNNSSNTALTNGSNNNSSSTNNKNDSLTLSDTSNHVVRPKDQLMYLANILNLQVQFTDIPKACLNALKALAEVGLDSVTS